MVVKNFENGNKNCSFENDMETVRNHSGIKLINLERDDNYNLNDMPCLSIRKYSTLYQKKEPSQWILNCFAKL